MKAAPPIIGPLEFDGIENSTILIEHDEDDDINLIVKSIRNKVNIIFTPDSSFDFSLSVMPHTAAVLDMVSIYKVYNIIKGLTVPVDNIIINRLDMMDLDHNKRMRGSQHAA